MPWAVSALNACMSLPCGNKSEDPMWCFYEPSHCPCQHRTCVTQIYWGSQTDAKSFYGTRQFFQELIWKVITHLFIKFTRTHTQTQRVLILYVEELLSIFAYLFKLHFNPDWFASRPITRCRYTINKHRRNPTAPTSRLCGYCRPTTAPSHLVPHAIFIHFAAWTVRGGVDRERPFCWPSSWDVFFVCTGRLLPASPLCFGLSSFLWAVHQTDAVAYCKPFEVERRGHFFGFQTWERDAWCECKMKINTEIVKSKRIQVYLCIAYTSKSLNYLVSSPLGYTFTRYSTEFWRVNLL